jgi:origin recognition complex subunit 1
MCSFDWPQRRHARLVVVGVANTMDLPERLPPRVCSRLGAGRIVFGAYTKEQIAKIVASRLSGLRAFDRDAVALAAAKVAAVSGDVRRALQVW